MLPDYTQPIDPATIFNYAKRIGMDAFFREIDESVRRGFVEHAPKLRVMTKNKIMGMASSYMSDGKILLGNNKYSLSHLYVSYALFIQAEVVLSYKIKNPKLDYLPITRAARQSFAQCINGAVNYQQLQQYFNEQKRG